MGLAGIVHGNQFLQKTQRGSGEGNGGNLARV